MTRQQLGRRLEFLRDLGIRELALPWAAAASPPVQPPLSQRPADRADPAVTAASPPPAAPPSSAPLSPPVMEPLFTLPPLAPPDDTLEQIRADLHECRRCRLCQGRTNIVFGAGNEKSPLVFVGEGPGAEEDLQGLPFVGRAGQLLTQMIDNTAEREGLAIRRSDVYICNVVKCRPPENRTPLPDEMETCGQFLFRQLTVIRPKAICCLGGTAAKALLGLKEGITKARGQWYRWREVPVMVTYHPSYLVRNPSRELRREAWEDLKKVLHFVYD